MANLEKGQVLLADIGGRDLTLEFTIDAICVLEGRLKSTAKDIMGRLGTDDSLTFMRTLLWVALKEHHPEFTEKTAGELIRQRGGDRISAKVIEAYFAMWPDPEEVAEGDDARPQTRPTPAEDSIGEPSSAGGVN